jgi:iron only hydrogenase large subunit-like protein
MGDFIAADDFPRYEARAEDAILILINKTADEAAALPVAVLTAVKKAMSEQNIDFEINAITCDGIEACKMALLKKSKNILDANFIEGMACIGGCIGGAGCLTHGEKNKNDVDKYASQATKKEIGDSELDI